MAKKVLVLTLSLFLILSLSVFGAKKPTKAVDEKMAQRLERIERTGYADESIVSQYLTTPEPKMLFPATGDTAGFTYYDYMHNDVQRRGIAYDPDNALTHIDWMNSVGSEPGTANRYVDYNSAYPWLSDGGQHVSPALQRAGYCGLDVLPADKREVLCFHQTQPETPRTKWASVVYIEKTTAGLGEFNAYDIPDSCAGSLEEGMWPTLAISKQTRADTAFMHITHAEGQLTGTADKQLGYVRCFEKPGVANTLVCQSPGWTSDLEIPANTRLVPNAVPYRMATARLGGITLATSPVSEKVAIVYYQNYASSQTQNDLMYVESTNNGDDWMEAGSMTPIKLTDYQTEDVVRAYCDLAVVYDQQDELHIMWTTFPSDNSNDVTLWHWSPSTGIRKACFATASSDVDPGAWNLLIAKFTLGVWDHPHPDSSYLYLLYTKFQEGDISAGEMANGDLYVKGSTNGGLTWGPENNLTNTNTNGCLPDSCLSEHWSSLAEIVDDSLHIQCTEDKDAGAGIRAEGEGVVTLNAMRYLKYARPSIPAVPSLTYSPAQMISPVRWATNGGSTPDEMYFDNVGTATLYVKLSGPSWLNIAPSSFNIAEAGATQLVNLTFNGASYADTFLVDSILVESNDGTFGEVYTNTDYVRVHFVVTDNFYYAEFDTCPYSPITTVSNIGNLGNQEEDQGMFYNGDNYLFESTPAFVTPDIEGQGPVSFTWLHENHDFLPEDTIWHEHYPDLDVIVHYSKFALLFPPRLPYHHLSWWWGYWTEYNKSIQYEGQTIAQWIWWVWNPPPVWWHDLSGSTDPQPGYFGIAADWDVTADASGRNLGGYDDTLHLVWLYSDTSGFENFYGGFLFLDAFVAKGTDTTYHGTEPFAAHVLANATQLYPEGGYDDDSLYKYMSTPGYSIESDSSQDMNIVMTFAEELSPDPTTVIGMKVALLVSDQGEAGLREVASKIKYAQAGDANSDGGVSVSDVVYLINYLFKGGDPPKIIWCQITPPW